MSCHTPSCLASEASLWRTFGAEVLLSLRLPPVSPAVFPLSPECSFPGHGVAHFWPDSIKARLASVRASLVIRFENDVTMMVVMLMKAFHPLAAEEVAVCGLVRTSSFRNTRVSPGPDSREQTCP